MSYRIEFVRSAERSLASLPQSDQRQIAKRVEALSQNPRPPGTKKLRGSEHTYRIRVGDYRVIYVVEDERVIVTVVRIAHRRDVYR